MKDHLSTGEQCRSWNVEASFDNGEMKDERNATVGVHHISDRGVVWLDQDRGAEKSLTITCRPTSNAEKQFWLTLPDVSIPGFWGLSHLEADGEKYRLVSPLQNGIPLATWLQKMRQRPTEVERMVEETLNLLDRIPEVLRGDKTRLGDNVVVTPEGIPLLAALPWFQVPKQDTDFSLSEESARELARAFEARTKKDRPQTATSEETQDAVRRDDSQEMFIDLAPTTAIPLTRLSPRRKGPYLVVSLLTLGIVASLVGLRWQTLAVESPTEWMSGAEGRNEVTHSADCPRQDEVLAALEKILNLRTVAIENLDVHQLESVEQQTILEEDRRLILEIERQGWAPKGLGFTTESITGLQCSDEVVTVRATISQQEFQQCTSDSCVKVPAQNPKAVVLDLSRDLNQLLSVQRE